MKGLSPTSAKQEPHHFTATSFRLRALATPSLRIHLPDAKTDDRGGLSRAVRVGKPQSKSFHNQLGARGFSARSPVPGGGTAEW